MEDMFNKPYKPTKWSDRVRTLPDRFFITKNDDNTYTLTPAGEIMVEGTPQDQTNFNNMEYGIQAAHVAIGILVNALRQLGWDNVKNLADIQQDISSLQEEDTALGGMIDTLTQNTVLSVSDIQNAIRLILNLARQNLWDINDIKAWISEHQIVQTGTKTLTNTKAFPFNNSKTTVALSPTKENTNYIVLPEVTAFQGNVGEIVICDKAVNGFAIAYTGSASSVTVKYTVLGGYEE